MSGNPSDSDPSALPSRSHMALAMAILNSMPANLELEEYLDELHASITVGRRRLPDPPEQHINTAGFWECAYKQVSTDNAALTRRVFELEEQGTSGHDVHAKPSGTPSRNPKRKTPVNSPAAANIQSKRRKVDGVTEDVYLTTQYDINLEVQLHPKSFSSAVRFLQRCLDTAVTKVLNIEKAMTATCQLASRLFDIPNSASPVAAQAHDISSLCSAVRKVQPLLLRAFTKCAEQRTPTDHLSNLCGSFAQLLQKILIHLGSVDSSIPTDDEIDATKRNTDTYQRNDGQRHRSPYETASLAVAIFTTIDMTEQSHQALFNALLCTLLDHIGTIISTLTFETQPQSPGTRMVIHPPVKLPYTPTRSGLQGLAWILSNVLRFRDEKRPLMASHASALAARRSKVEETLQKSLLRGIFGSGDEAFLEAMVLPSIPPQINLDEVLQQDADADSTSEWFIGLVWEHIGWEFLAK